MLACLFLVGGTLGGCAVSMPMASLIPDHHDDDTTGTVAKPQLLGWLDRDDWQHAKPAFSRALAEKPASSVAWDNPTSGTKGAFMALGDTYPGTSGPCRAFHADIDGQTADKSLEGTACADKSGAWQVTEVKPANKS